MNPDFPNHPGDPPGQWTKEGKLVLHWTLEAGMVNLGTLGGATIYPVDINEAGQKSKVLTGDRDGTSLLAPDSSPLQRRR